MPRTTNTRQTANEGGTGDIHGARARAGTPILRESFTLNLIGQGSQFLGPRRSIFTDTRQKSAREKALYHPLFR